MRNEASWASRNLAEKSFGRPFSASWPLSPKSFFFAIRPIVPALHQDQVRVEPSAASRYFFFLLFFSFFLFSFLSIYGSLMTEPAETLRQTSTLSSALLECSPGPTTLASNFSQRARKKPEIDKIAARHPCHQMSVDPLQWLSVIWRSAWIKVGRQTKSKQVRNKDVEAPKAEERMDAVNMDIRELRVQLLERRWRLASVNVVKLFKRWTARRRLRHVLFISEYLRIGCLARRPNVSVIDIKST